jgi:hypothetical protein
MGEAGLTTKGQYSSKTFYFLINHKFGEVIFFNVFSTDSGSDGGGRERREQYIIDKL